jgi:hypothetical protein
MDSYAVIPFKAESVFHERSLPAFVTATFFSGTNGFRKRVRVALFGIDRVFTTYFHFSVTREADDTGSECHSFYNRKSESLEVRRVEQYVRGGKGLEQIRTGKPSGTGDFGWKTPKNRHDSIFHGLRIACDGEFDVLPSELFEREQTEVKAFPGIGSIKEDQGYGAIRPVTTDADLQRPFPDIGR